MNTAASLAAVTIPARAAYRLEILPGEFAGPWKKSLAWAKEQGGELPTREEMLFLYAGASGEFKPDYYWTSEQHADVAGYAWSQHFGWGYQDDCPQDY